MNAEQLSARLLNFAVAIIALTRRMPKTPEGQHIRSQLLRAGTSPGANYEEARGAESKKDFTHKLGIALKELRESRYWLKVTLKTELLPQQALSPTTKECEELCAIIAKSVGTARKKQKNEK